MLLVRTRCWSQSGLNANKRGNEKQGSRPGPAADAALPPQTIKVGFRFSNNNVCKKCKNSKTGKSICRQL